ITQLHIHGAITMSVLIFGQSMDRGLQYVHTFPSAKFRLSTQPSGIAPPAPTLTLLDTEYTFNTLGQNS
ncbi:hypothetical protein, partial [Xanthomonas arboricola]